MIGIKAAIYNYNNRERPIPNNYQNRYDTIYFISPCPDKIDDEIVTLEDMFDNHDGLVSKVTKFEMKNQFKPNQTTHFISIKMMTTDLKDDEFYAIAKKINKEL